MKIIPTIQLLMRIGIGGFMLNAAYGHFIGNPADFNKIVPEWLPFSPSFVVKASGVVEALIGIAAIFVPTSYLMQLGWALVAFLVLVFPANIYQYTHHIDSFGLDTDAARLNRLYMQPVMILVVMLAFDLFGFNRKK